SRRRPAAVAVAASGAVSVRRAAVPVRAVRGRDPRQRRAGAVLLELLRPPAAEVRVGRPALRVRQDPAPSALRARARERAPQPDVERARMDPELRCELGGCLLALRRGRLARPKTRRTPGLCPNLSTGISVTPCPAPERREV